MNNINEIEEVLRNIKHNEGITFKEMDALDKALEALQIIEVLKRNYIKLVEYSDYEDTEEDPIALTFDERELIKRPIRKAAFLNLNIDYAYFVKTKLMDFYIN